MTRIHHLNCGSMAPVAGGRLMPGRMVAHCLLIERADGLVLVDAGFGTADLLHPGKRLGRGFVRMVGPSLDPAETAVAQVRGLGFDPRDVRDVVLTHLDLDHAGGIGDFPTARVHVHATELEAAQHPKLRERGRYRSDQWSHGPNWIPHVERGDDWFGLRSVKAVADDVLLVPLHGHSRGHSGVAVRRPEGGWLLHAGDSYFFHGETATPPTFHRGLSGFQTVVQADKEARLANQERLRELRLRHGHEVRIFSAHDPVEYDELAGT